MKSYQLAHIQRSFTPNVFARGRDYAQRKRVLDAWCNSKDQICGTVRGSDESRYDVVITLGESGYGPVLDSTCTCSDIEQCKHGVALAIHAMTSTLVLRDQDLESPEMGRDDEGEPSAEEAELEIPIPPELTTWLDNMATSLDDRDEFDPAAKMRAFYVFDTKTAANGAEVPTVVIVTRSIVKSGQLGNQSDLKIGTITVGTLPKFLNRYDKQLVIDIDRNAVRLDWNRAEYRLDGSHGARLVEAIVQSGRSVWQRCNKTESLQMGPVRSGTAKWVEADENGSLKPEIDFGGEGGVLSVTPPWYIDTKTNQCGPLNCNLSGKTLAAFLRAAPIKPEIVPAVRARLARLGLKGSVLPKPRLTSTVRAPMPVPHLLIQFEQCNRTSHTFNEVKVSAPVAFAVLKFEYEGIAAPHDGSDIRVVKDNEILLLRRNQVAEQSALQRLERNGWSDPTYSGWDIPRERSNSLCIVPPDDFRLQYPIERVDQLRETLIPKLIEAGWEIDLDDKYRIVEDEDVEWDLGLESGSGIDWFEFQVGIRVEGKPFDLKDVLKKLFTEQSGLTSRSSRGREGAETDDMFVFDTDGRAIRLSRKRLNSILRPLVELFGGVSDWPADLRLPKAMLSEASIFEENVEDSDVTWHTTDELKGLANRLEEFDRLQPLQEPPGFKGELRGYQKEGLAWLNFLREYEFGGILADDMGLGKTVQILAFLQRERSEGRLELPTLIVAPTSTMPNWRREIERFTPELRVVTLQGAGRHGRFSELTDCDIALTTYPLLARDKDHLKKTTYHAIVLDEAQNVKNPITIAARAARELTAKYRFCMSGTPVENHLGELWSLFHFLMPGFLGTDTEFRRKFRVPIEKGGDTGARDRLARRIRPFMLRRTKDKVVKELPAKTEIIETVEFEDQQRDFYESIRLAMDEQVRRIIATQGFDRSRIQILDALLKLRQVCCDPRLVKLPSAENVTGSAKLDRLMDMLSVLIEDGRKILLFSQFTSMLNLIEERLKTAGIKWVRISGDTVDREKPVQRFQNGEVPLFLISLKAGGTGLNLTAADTVILYDPWWNPAVENQAIDRAHRIGQDKAVMVYRLVAAGTIEEKMLQMQARKGDLARSILTDDGDVIKSLTAEDLQWVLSKD